MRYVSHPYHSLSPGLSLSLLTHSLHLLFRSNHPPLSVPEWEASVQVDASDCSAPARTHVSAGLLLYYTVNLSSVSLSFSLPLPFSCRDVYLLSSLFPLSFSLPVSLSLPPFLSTSHSRYPPFFSLTSSTPLCPPLEVSGVGCRVLDFSSRVSGIRCRLSGL